MMTFYAAVGSYRIENRDGHKAPYIQKLGKLYPISIPEFMIWSTLLWEVMTYAELKKQYESMVSGFDARLPEFDELLDMLLKRKLIVRGLGYTGTDALFNMLSDAFVVPYGISAPRKAWTVLKLWAKGRIGLTDIFRLFRIRNLSSDEDRVIRLVKQTPLSTAEIIRCFEREIFDVSSPEKVIAGIYPDDDSEQCRIANEESLSKHKSSVLRAVSNLYLNRRVILEVV